MNNMNVIVYSLPLDFLLALQKRINRTRRRFIPFVINASTQLFPRRDAKRCVDEVIVSRAPH